MRGVSLLMFLLASLRGQIAEAGTTITVGQAAGYDYPTIQAGIDAATTGDTVVVHPGIYYECIYFGGKNITLRSTDPLDSPTVAATVIDGVNGLEAVVFFFGSESSSCTLSGFTIRNGKDWGGIRGDGTHATIQNNVISNNNNNYAGGGHSPAGVQSKTTRS